jgi:hypothetical protein
MANSLGSVIRLLAFVGLAGCNTLADSVAYEHHLPSRKTDAASVEILSAYPSKTYVEVAKVEAYATSMWIGWDALHDALRREAARLGADALVNLQPPDDPADSIVVTGIGWIDYLLKPPRHVSAIAIRYI